jgi:hypothetical protein
MLYRPVPLAWQFVARLCKRLGLQRAMSAAVFSSAKLTGMNVEAHVYLHIQSLLECTFLVTSTQQRPSTLTDKPAMHPLQHDTAPLENTLEAQGHTSNNPVPSTLCHRNHQP